MRIEMTKHFIILKFALHLRGKFGMHRKDILSRCNLSLYLFFFFCFFSYFFRYEKKKKRRYIFPSNSILHPEVY